MSQQAKGGSGGRYVMVGLVAAAMIGLLAMAPRRRPPAKPSADPVACITALIDAATAGNVDGYLECFGGAARQRLETQRDASGARRFGEFLQAGLVGLNGLAFHDQEQPAADRVRLTVERIFADYNERQTFELVRVGERWAIDQMGPAARYVPSIRYGTPAGSPPAAPSSAP